MSKNNKKMLWVGFLSLALFTFMSCNSLEENQPDLNLDSELADIPTTLKMMEEGPLDEANINARRNMAAKPTFSTFNAALGRTGLASVFARNELTVFAPTDAAFAALGLNPGNIRNQPNLREILLYHVVAGSVFAADLSEGFVPTVNGAAVEISLSDGPKVNDANIVLVDVTARNGVIHGIDAVLLPPALNLVDLALDFDPEFSILVALLEEAKLTEVVRNAENLTVFAPTNQAFADLLEELPYNSLEELLADIGNEGLQNILLYHVVNGRVFSSDLVDGADVETLLEGSTFKVDLANLSLLDGQNRSVGLVPDLLNVQASNGVIHVVSRVLRP